MLAADAELEICSLVAAPSLDAHLDELAHADRVEALERVDGRIPCCMYDGRKLPASSRL